MKITDEEFNWILKRLESLENFNVETVVNTYTGVCFYRLTSKFYISPERIFEFHQDGSVLNDNTYIMRDLNFSQMMSFINILKEVEDEKM